MYLNVYVFLTLINVSFGEFLGPILANLKYFAVSPIFEQCDERWVKENIVDLENDLNKHVFGQDLALDVIITALRSHQAKTKHKKPLVLNFHGSLGGGKNYVADFILKHWYKNGAKSNFVRTYHAKIHFPLKSDVYDYQRILQDQLEETISKCPKAMFVFDEVDKFPPKILDGITPYLDHNSHINGYDYRKAIFIFITNNGNKEITSITLQKRSDGVHRQDLKMHDFENVLKSTAFNDEGGFYQSDLIERHVIDYVVPFLPLERQHVASCIQTEWLSGGGDPARLEEVTREILADMTFGPPELELYSINGCKSIFEKVNYIFERGRREQHRPRKHSEL